MPHDVPASRCSRPVLCRPQYVLRCYGLLGIWWGEPLMKCVPLAGSSTVDLLIYQTLCYAQEDLDVDVEQYLLKVCGQAEFLSK